MIVNGSVGDIKAPKYKVSRNVNESEGCGINWTNTYIRALKRKEAREVREIKKSILLRPPAEFFL